MLAIHPIIFISHKFPKFLKMLIKAMAFLNHSIYFQLHIQLPSSVFPSSFPLTMGPRPLPVRETAKSQNRVQVRPQKNKSMCQSREPSNYLASSKEMRRSNQLLALVGRAAGWLLPAQAPQRPEPPQIGGLPSASSATVN